MLKKSKSIFAREPVRIFSLLTYVGDLKKYWQGEIKQKSKKDSKFIRKRWLKKMLNEKSSQ